MRLAAKLIRRYLDEYYINNHCMNMFNTEAYNLGIKKHNKLLKLAMKIIAYKSPGWWV